MYVVCAVCGKEFKRIPAKVKVLNYCSPECSYKGRSKTKEKLCDFCRKSFYYQNCREETAKFCSTRCRADSQKGLTWRQTETKIEKFDNHAEIVINSPTYGEKRALIDLDDVERCLNLCWHIRKSGDVFYVSCKSKRVQLHRFILNYNGKLQIDHRNRNPLDNRKENIWVCTPKENLSNRRPYKTRKDKGCARIKGEKGDLYGKQYVNSLSYNPKRPIYRRSKTCSSS